MYKRRFDREFGEQKDLFIGSYGDGEIADLQAVMWDCDDMMMVIFDYYAAINADGRISSMTFNEWGMFVEDFHLADAASKNCKRADLDRVFIAVDTKAAMTQQAQQASKTVKGKKSTTDINHDDLKKKVLHRVEFMVALVHIAVLRYIESGEMNDVSDALQRLLVDDIAPHFSQRILADPNVFRQRACYRRDVDQALMACEPSLRNVFLAICHTGGRGEKERHMSMTEWTAFCHGTEVLGIDLSERDAMMCFAWSRMCVVDVESERGKMRETHLPFEGFCKAIVRLSVLKALPTDDEVAAAECKNAYEYFRKLRVEDEAKYQEILATRGVKWGHAPSQPVGRCIAHLLALLICSIEYSGSGGDDGFNMEITEKEAKLFAKRVTVSNAG